MYMMLIDTSRCISCRACQVACKMWHALPPENNNDPRTDLTGTTFTLVRETEGIIKVKDAKTAVVRERLVRLFFKDQCRHCVSPRCMYACPKKAIKRERCGAVVVDQTLCKPDECAVVNPWGKKYPCLEKCWYHILRLDPVKNTMRKCDFCFDRIRERKDGSPRATACADACPSGAIYFDTAKKVLAEAKKRLVTVQKRYPDARIGGFHATPRVRWILLGRSALYGLDTIDRYTSDK